MGDHVVERHAISVDVEDYWSVIQRDWLGREIAPTDAVVTNTEWFLHIFEQHQVRGTFFFLGDVAEHYPQLVKDTAAQGHEIGVHGYRHQQVFKLDRESFRAEVRTCRDLLQDLSGQPVRGHRAPAFSILPHTAWALDVLAEEGFTYDSSVFPIKGSRYGWPGFSLDITDYQTESGRKITVVPMSVCRVLHRRLPVAGGGYLRHFPFCVTRRAIDNVQQNRPAIVYMHPYEVDTDDRGYDARHLSIKRRLRLYLMHKLQLRNRHTMKTKIERLLQAYRFTSIGEMIEHQESIAAQPDPT